MGGWPSFHTIQASGTPSQGSAAVRNQMEGKYVQDRLRQRSFPFFMEEDNRHFP